MKVHAWIGFLLVCILGCGAAEDDDDSDFDFTQQEIGTKEKNVMAKLCSTDAAGLANMDKLLAKLRACEDPEMQKATAACQTAVYGSAPKTAADMQKVLCPADKDKQKKFIECMKGKGLKKPTDEERKKFKECLKAKGTK